VPKGFKKQGRVEEKADRDRQKKVRPSGVSLPEENSCAHHYGEDCDGGQCEKSSYDHIIVMSGGHGHEITGKEIFAKKRVRQKRQREEQKSRAHDQQADSDRHVSSKAPHVRPPDKQQAERKRDEQEKAPHV